MSAKASEITVATPAVAIRSIPYRANNTQVIPAAWEQVERKVAMPAGMVIQPGQGIALGIHPNVTSSFPSFAEKMGPEFCFQTAGVAGNHEVLLEDGGSIVQSSDISLGDCGIPILVHV